MRKHNKWSLGPTALAIPELDQRLLGATGCRFDKAIFDPKIGEEIYLSILETPDYATAYAQTRPFNLHAAQGLVRTKNGIVAFVVWSIAAGSPRQSDVEQFLNPNSVETIRLVSSLGNQTHLKALVIDSTSSSIRDWFEFENVYAFDQFCAAMAQAVGHEPVGNFSAAVQEVTAKYSTQDLLNLNG
jgi:hypothetical protein